VENKNVKCSKCDSINFMITESLTWKASVDDDNQINAYNKGNEIESITCVDCNEDLTELLIDEIINFQ